MKVKQLQALSLLIADGDLQAARSNIAALLAVETGKHWRRDLQKLSRILDGGAPEFKIFASGNMKLSFLAYSSLPGRGFCPGAGDCLQWCYSFRAWRYPAAFCRQAQNSVLMQSETGRGHILTALDTFDKGATIDFRLYVDGDFGSVADVRFWMSALYTRPWLKTYGYSKSWRELLSFNAEYDGVWPANYKLNLSSGSVHADALKRAIAALPITRGEFIAVSVGHKVKTADHADRAHQKELRAAFGASCFTCPGKCDTCTPKGHACGSERFQGVPIVIAVH